MHDESLTKEAGEILPFFEKFEGFYLAGGTALALQIGHRISVDFDALFVSIAAAVVLFSIVGAIVGWCYGKMKNSSLGVSSSKSISKIL